MFKARKPLSLKAKRAGWQGFVYDLSVLPPSIPVLIWKSQVRQRPSGTRREIKKDAR